MSSRFPDPELRALIDGALEGAMDDSMRARLAERLDRDCKARAFYLRQVELHALLEWEHGAVGAQEHVTGESFWDPWPPNGRFAFTRAVYRAGAALALLAAALAVVLFLREPFGGGRGGIAAAASYYGRSTSTPAIVGLFWKPGLPEPRSRAASLGPGTVRLDRGAARVSFVSGADVTLDGPAALGLVSAGHAALFSGTLEVHRSRSTSAFTIDTPSVRLLDTRGTDFVVKVDADGMTELRVLEGSVQTQASTRLPRYYWSFDEGPDASLADSIGFGRAEHGAGARRVPGIAGFGAVDFDNTRDAFVDVGTGGGHEVGTGDFSVSTGVTIEALIITRWSGRGASTGDEPDYDEIFRKEDGDYRILLSFQNDRWDYEVPPVEEGPCLSFGLYLADLGYSELDMPLDGKAGRPALGELRDGRLHHIVAAYDSASGRKAIYIDGVLRFWHDFRPGTLAISGGSARATIGNTGPRSLEPFDGTIDEVAFYECALVGEEVADHWANVSNGRNYFGMKPSVRDGAMALKGKGWRPVARVGAHETMRFDARTGFPVSGR